MATKRVQRVWDGLSATQWIQSCVAEYNDQLPSGVPKAAYLGDVTVPYAGGIMANPSMPVTQWQSYYDIAQQLCFDEGCWLFESGGCVVFGKPSWIVTVAPTFKIGYRGPTRAWKWPKDGDAVETLGYPNCLRSVSVFTGDTMQVELPRSLGEQVRVGQVAAVSGVPFWSAKQWIVTGVQFPFDGGETPVRVTLNEAKDPVPAAPGGVPPSPPQSDPTGRPPQATNLQFVDIALTQVGVPYAWGGETAGAGFDCSGLVQWALQQLGVKFPRTTGEQYAACAAIPGADKGPALAALIRGSLLFVDGGGVKAGEHVAISMGQTRNGDSEVLVLQAPHTGAKVGTAWVNISYFNEGAIVPQLNYGTQGGGGG
jgi:cell wall-associated NlpC family hydrolase